MGCAVSRRYTEEELRRQKAARCAPFCAVIQASGTYQAITTGPEDALWFPEPPDKIGRITTASHVTSFVIPASAEPNGIAAGPDGALRFTMSPGKIGRITTADAVNEYQVPGRNNTPWSITAGPDGALWFTEFHGREIGRISTAGVITKYPLSSRTGDAYEITAVSWSHRGCTSIHITGRRAARPR